MQEPRLRTLLPPPLPRWVMVGDNHTILTTTDPADFTTAWKFTAGGELNGVTTDGKGNWVAVGTNGIYPAKIGPAGEWQPIATGATVTAAALGEVASLFGFTNVATDGTIWVAVGGLTKIATSTTADLTTWTANTSAITDVLRSVATDGKGTWVAVGNNGTILTSMNPTGAWDVPRTTTGAAADTGAGSNILYGVTTDGKGTWVAVGAGGTIVTKSPAGTWAATTAGTAGSNNLYGVTTDGKGTWVAVSGVTILTTTTPAGIWTSASASGNFDAVATDGKGTWVAVGSNNLRATTTDITSWQVTASPIDFGGTARTLSFNAVAVEQP